MQYPEYRKNIKAGSIPTGITTALVVKTRALFLAWVEAKNAGINHNILEYDSQLLVDYHLAVSDPSSHLILKRVAHSPRGMCTEDVTKQLMMHWQQKEHEMPSLTSYYCVRFSFFLMNGLYC